MAGLEEGNTNRKNNAKGAGPSRSHKNVLLSQSLDQGPVTLPQEVKRRTGEEWRERPADNCCRCAEQGTKLMSSRCAEEGVCSRGWKAPPSLGGKEKYGHAEQRPTGS